MTSSGADVEWQKIPIMEATALPHWFILISEIEVIMMVF
jgi:hypothetical protein